MEFHQLRTLLAVLEHGSFSRAGEALHLTQSTVSFHIKTLEEGLGITLLERHARPVRATAAGATLAVYAERLLDLRQEAAERLRQQREGGAGRIVIAASTIPAAYLLPRALAALRVESPGVSIQLEVSDSSRALAALRNRDCDLAVVGARERDPRLVFTPVATDEVVLVARTGTPWATGTTTIEALAAAPIVLREEGSGTQRAVAGLLARRAACDPSGPSVRVGSTAAAHQCLLAGLGVSFISRQAVREDLARGILVELPLPGTPVTRRFYAARLRSGALRPAVRQLVRHLASTIDEVDTSNALHR